MRPPEFWDKDGRRAPFLEALAWPVSLAYERIGAARLNAPSARVAKPVICVGNVSLGGTGKTPIVRAIRAHLRAAGLNAHVLSRGYGGALKGPTRVDPAAHGASEVGDEPLLHALDGPTWIARDRAAGARAAIAAGCDAIVMDDGFQNPALAKDISLLVFDAGAGLGNGKVFPAGPLRERVSAALKRAQAAVLIGPDEAPALDDFGGPILRAKIEPAAPAPAGKLVAFAGIGRPEKFFATLAAVGADVVDAMAFADHHAYGASDRRFLTRLAGERGARLITTEKDYMRLAPDWRAEVTAFPIVARFADEAALAALLAPAIEAR